MQRDDEERPEAVVCEEALKAVLPPDISETDYEEALKFVRQYEEEKWKRFTKGKDLLNTVPNVDEKSMQPLPYYLKQDSKATLLLSANHKMLAMIYGSDERVKTDHQWCTKAQRLKHAEYLRHTASCFPLMQETMEKIYACEEMPEDAIRLIEFLMAEVYLEEVPAYAEG